MGSAQPASGRDEENSRCRIFKEKQGSAGIAGAFDDARDGKLVQRIGYGPCKGRAARRGLEGTGYS